MCARIRRQGLWASSCGADSSSFLFSMDSLHSAILVAMLALVSLGVIFGGGLDAASIVIPDKTLSRVSGTPLATQAIGEMDAGLRLASGAALRCLDDPSQNMRVCCAHQCQACGPFDRTCREHCVKACTSKTALQ